LAVTGPLRVRRATVDDGPALARLATRTFVAAFGPDNRAADVERYVSEAFSETRLAAELEEPASTFLLACEAGADEAVGYAHLRVGPNAAVAARRPVELVRLYVEQPGTGVGGRLLDAALDEAAQAGHDVVWLGVWERNTGARRFYERWGFSFAGEVGFDLGDDRQTDLLMSRPAPRARSPR
jgi:diamine N-acetyltransferase